MEDLSDLRTFEPLDELRYAFIGKAKIAPDGQGVIFELRQNEIETDRSFTSLWYVGLENGAARQLTSGQANSTAPAWSPDGRQVAFLSDRDGIKQIYLMPGTGGRARQFTDLPQGVGSGPVWAPDGKTIAYTAGPETGPPDPDRPYRVTRFIYRYDGIGNLDHAVQNIFVQGTEGGKARQLTDDRHRNHTLRWSPDGRELLYLASYDPERAEVFFAKIRVLKLTTGATEVEVEELLGLDSQVFMTISGMGGVWNVGWAHDGQSILFAGETREQPLGRIDLWMIHRESGALENRTQGLKWGIQRIGKLVGSNKCLVNVVREGQLHIYTVALTGKRNWQPLVVGKRVTSLLDSNDGKMLFLARSLENPGELSIANLDGSAEHQITQVNRELVRRITFPKVENFHFVVEKDQNGVEIQIEGWLLVPPTGRPPYPTILCIHGGPPLWYGFEFYSDFQMLAGAGYAVLFTNPRGSRGYGDEFMATLTGKWGVMDFKDVMAGVDHVIAGGLADPDRLGVYGLSYGGYLACFIVGQTDRFKAAVAENPLTDLMSRYGTSDMGPWASVSQMGGRPHEVPDVYRRSSPITYAHRCKTPILLIQSEQDFRCPAGQSDQFYTHLKAGGCITEMIRFPKMSHTASINGPLNVQKFQNDALLDWMNRFVLE